MLSIVHISVSFQRSRIPIEHWSEYASLYPVLPNSRLCRSSSVRILFATPFDDILFSFASDSNSTIATAVSFECIGITPKR